MNGAPFPQSALAALDRGDPLAAERDCRRQLQANPHDPHAQSLLPITLLHQGRPADAVPLLEQLVLRQADEPSHAVNLGLALIELGRHDEAIVVLERSARRWPDDPAILAALGQAQLHRGFARAAVDTLTAAFRHDPVNAHTATMLARALQESGERDRAWQIADRVLRANPADAATMSELALVLAGAQRDADAEVWLQKAIAADTQSGTARVHLAQLLERHNRLDEAEAAISHPSIAGSSDPLLALIRGRLMRRRKQYQDAVDELRQLLRIARSGPLVAEAATELGLALDALGRTDEAFAAFTTGNECMLEAESGRPGGGPLAQSPGQWVLRTYDASEVAAWSAPVAPAPEPPIFIVGFPRSGTTLLENALDAHPALQALEEKPAVDAMLAMLAARNGVDPGLAAIDDESAAALRQAYWNSVARYVERRPGTRLVDRYPLNMARLAVIQRVFPGAPIVLLVRHPCDVVLSCFMQNFRIMDGTAGFHRIVNGARIYDQLMRKWVAEVEAFAPPLHVLRYEDLAADYEPTLRSLVAFLGIEWDERMLDPGGHARRRGRIHTPSYSQVVEPVYTHAIGRWQRYRFHLGEALEILGPWVRHWQYEDPAA